MKTVNAILAAVCFGFSLNAVAAASDLSSVTHGADYGSELKTGQIFEPAFSDRSASKLKRARGDVKPLAESAGNYRFSDINSVTHN